MGRLNAGALRERVTLYTPGTPVPDGRGGYTPGPETSAAVYARVRPLSGTEKVRLGQVVNEVAYEVTIRHRAAVSAKQRLTWKDQPLAVLAVLPDESREYLLLTCIHGGQSD